MFPLIIRVVAAAVRIIPATVIVAGLSYLGIKGLRKDKK
jgi:hypothetical protein